VVPEVVRASHASAIAYGGLVQNTIRVGANYPLHKGGLELTSRGSDLRKYGSYLLPDGVSGRQPAASLEAEGAWGDRGACVTALKAFVQRGLRDRQSRHRSDDGQVVAFLHGRRCETDHLGGELDKPRRQCRLGPRYGGVHWRSDTAQALLLGEARHH